MGYGPERPTALRPIRTHKDHNPPPSPRLREEPCWDAPPGGERLWEGRGLQAEGEWGALEEGGGGHALCHPWRLAGRQHRVLQASPATRGGLGFRGHREHRRHPGEETQRWRLVRNQRRLCKRELRSEPPQPPSTPLKAEPPHTHLSTIVSGSTVSTTRTLGAGGALDTALTGETSLTLQEEERS